MVFSYQFFKGKKVRGLYNCWNRNLDLDLDQLKSAYKITTLVTLIEDFEFKNMSITDLFPKCKERKIENIFFPIEDGNVPDSIEKFHELIKTLLQKLKSGEVVIIHCMGGLGRTGTVAAGILIVLGEDVSNAISCVRKVRPGAIETVKQEEFLKEYEQFIKK